MTSFFIPGVPAPQGSHRAFIVKDKRTGRARPVLAESAGERHKAWRSMVAYTTAEQAAPIDGAVRVALTFYMPRPKSAPKSRRHPAVRPDLDKLVRSTLDGLRDGGAYRDDAQVVFLRADKVYAVSGGRPGCSVTLEACTA
jgi:crossover junction endodeoxyribonuclease RusA